MRGRRGMVGVLFAATCLAQLAVPAHMLWQRERVLEDGVALRFRTRAFDPADPLRGRYVRLQFEDALASPGPGCCAGVERPVAALRVGEDGFARLGPLTASPPTEGPWLEVEAVAGGPDRPWRVHLPFDRFYLEEGLAPAAEAALRRRGDGVGPAWLVVRVLDGRAVPESLMIDGVPVRDYVEARP